jgi:hypothetical protein
VQKKRMNIGKASSSWKPVFTTLRKEHKCDKPEFSHVEMLRNKGKK